MKDTFKQILKYLHAVYRYKYIFIAISLVIMTGLGIYGLNFPRKYQADTTVFIENNVIDELIKGIAITPSIEDRVRVLKYAITSRDMILKTLTELNSKKLTLGQAEQQAYITSLVNRIQISVTRQLDRFNVSLIDTDPVFAQRFINTLVGRYVEENISATRDETYGANRFLQEQIAIFKEKLEQAEDKIIEYRNKQGVYFSVDEDTTLSDIRNLTNQVEEIELTLETLRARKGQLQEQLANLSPTIDVLSQTSEEGNRLISMEKQLSNLLLRYTENYPEVIRLRSEIDALKQRLDETGSEANDGETTRMTSLNPLYQELQGQVFGIDAELSSQAARKRTLEQSIAKREKELREVPTAKKELGIMMQERDSYKKIYNDLLARMGKSEVSKQMEIGNKAPTFRIIDPAILPEVPVSPNMLKILLIALAGGFGCGLGVVFLLESADSRIRDVQVLENLGVEILAVVPNIADPLALKKRFKKDLLLFTASGAYVCCFLGVFAYEIFLH